jgi:hypothetical protein
MSAAVKEALKRILVWSADLTTTEKQLRDEFEAALLIVNVQRDRLQKSKERQAEIAEILAKVADSTMERWIIRS